MILHQMSQDGDAQPSERNEDQSKDQNNEQNGAMKDIVTPWEVSSSSAKGIDYEKLIQKFGCSPLGADLVERIEKLTGKRAHTMLRRGFFFAQRDLSLILDRHEKGKPFFLYTGRGPSSGSLHLGHLIPFIFTKYLQEAFDVPLIIQMTDDEKFLWKNMKLEEAQKMCIENIKDIISVGFDPKKTFIFTNTNYMCEPFYCNILKIWKCVTYNQERGIFGLTESDPLFKLHHALAPAFPHVFNNKKDIPCLIPAAIDQDPYFRMTRDVAPRLKYVKPAMLYSTFLPALQGSQTKMAASDESSCIYLSDTPKQIASKINKHAFSGGQATAEEHRKLGGNCEVDTSFQFLRYFLDDDENGEMLSGEMKKEAITLLQTIIGGFQERRKTITDETVKQFTAIRALDFNF
ncbi:Tryptophanyl-tRNA synthetase [Aphelenchoides bicaudatus]|nr:Tryptophanyl-tRNA synthetase [Aphelenchoides bicaudatus]